MSLQQHDSERRSCSSRDSDEFEPGALATHQEIDPKYFHGRSMDRGRSAPRSSPDCFWWPWPLESVYGGRWHSALRYRCGARKIGRTPLPCTCAAALQPHSLSIHATADRWWARRREIRLSWVLRGPSDAVASASPARPGPGSGKGVTVRRAGPGDARRESGVGTEPSRVGRRGAGIGMRF